MMVETFNGTNITVIPIEGNHDVWPSNMQDFSVPYGSPFVLDYAEMWQSAGWLTNEDLVIFRKYGYYSKFLTLVDGR